MANKYRAAFFTRGVNTREKDGPSKKNLCLPEPRSEMIVQALKKAFFCSLLCSFLVSCATVQGTKPVSVGDHTDLANETDKDLKVHHSEAKKGFRHSSPTPSSYFHTLLGLKYEQERVSGSGTGNLRLALQEYLLALEDDPKAFFLIKRVAILLNRMGDHEQAVHFAKRAVNLKPNDIEILDLLGDIYLTSDETEKAVKTFKEIIRITPDRSDAYYRIGLIYANRKEFDRAERWVLRGVNTEVAPSLGYYYLGKISIGRGRPEKGLEFLEEAVELNGLLEPAHIEIAMIYERQKRARDAIKVYRRILEDVNPRNREAMHRVVALLIKEGAIDESLEFLEVLAARDPSNIDISLELVRVWVEKKEYVRAIGRLLSVVNTVPREISLRVYLASLYEQNKQFKEALAVYQRVLEEMPDAYAVRIRLGALHYYRLNDIEAALSQGEAAKEIDPGRAESYIFSGLVLFDAEKYEEAAETFKEGIDVSPMSPELHFHLGAVYDKLDRFDDLVLEMERAIKLDPNHANALNYLGYTYAERGIRLNEAIDLVNRALAVRPNDGYFTDSLGWAYFKKGMTKDALAVLKKAVSLVPDDPVIHEHLGEVYLGENENDLAREAWMQSLSLNPENKDLISRFKAAGFGDPLKIEGLQKEKGAPEMTLKEESKHLGTPMEVVH